MLIFVVYAHVLHLLSGENQGFDNDIIVLGIGRSIFKHGIFTKGSRRYRADAVYFGGSLVS